MKFLLIISMFLALLSSSQAQEQYFAINPKQGYVHRNGKAIATGVEVNTSLFGWLVGVDWVRFHDFGGPYHTEKTFHEIGALIGQHYSFSWFKFQMQGGIAPIWGDFRVDPDLVTTGFAYRMGFKAVLNPHIAFGLDVRLNINKWESMVHSMLSMEFGNVRVPQDVKKRKRKKGFR